MASFDSSNILLEVSPLALKRFTNIFVLNKMVETPRGILEKKYLTGTKEICSGKCCEKGGCQHRGTQEIVESIWTQDAFKREVISHKSS